MGAVGSLLVGNAVLGQSGSCAIANSNEQSALGTQLQPLVPWSFKLLAEIELLRREVDSFTLK